MSQLVVFHSLFSISLSFIFAAMEAVTLVSRWQLSGFAFIWLLENQSKSFNDSFFRKSKTLSSLSPDANGVLSFAWPTRSISSIRIWDGIFRKIEITYNIREKSVQNTAILLSELMISPSSINAIFALNGVLYKRNNLTVLQSLLLSVMFFFV